MNPLTSEFAALFDGFKQAYGAYKISGTKPSSGKVIGKAASLVGEVTLDLWEKHLMGVQGLGIIPINAESMAKFGAIDIDDYDLDIIKLAAKIDKLHMPLVVCRTKSGGAHAYLFTTEQIPALVMQERLRDMSAALGYGNCEIFPKQSQLLVSRGDAGNWINMPYFDHLSTMRYAVDHRGRKLDVHTFLALAKQAAVTPKYLESLKFDIPDLLGGGPPCLNQLVKQGFPAGSRNNGLFNLGVYARKAYPDDWKQRLEGFNNQHMNPPLSPAEVLATIKSLDKHSYTYTCRSHPIQAFCNAAVCRTCAHGVGGARLGMPAMGTLTKLCTVPPLWFIDVETVTGTARLELTTDELQQPRLFQKKCLEQLNVMPQVMKQENWQNVVTSLLETVNIVEVPVEATPYGLLMNHLEAFCTSRVTARTSDEILMGKPWINNDEVHFRIADFLAYLARVKFNEKELGLNRIAFYLKELKGYRKQFHNIRGKGANCYVIPTSTFKFQQESFEPPTIDQDPI